MTRLVRLWGKKRGQRMSGWWLVGSVGEAAFFGALFLLGIVSLTTIGTWQVFWPQSQIIRIGVGFWLMIIASASFILIGLSGLVFQVAQTVASRELRTALAQKAKREHARRSEGVGSDATPPTLPRLRSFTESPGVQLAFRLAVERGEIAPFLLSSLFALAWNTMLAILAVIAAQNIARGQPEWFLNVILVPFACVGFWSTRWFFRLLKRHTGIGPTAVEISDLPLLPGSDFSVYVCQYGRVDFRNLTILLVCFEESTYQQGTDLRTERVEVARHVLFEQESCSAEPEKPLEIHCQYRLPADTMHTFQSQHNAVVWKIVVEGDAPRWPSFCRKFPVVVHPLAPHVSLAKPSLR